MKRFVQYDNNLTDYDEEGRQISPFYMISIIEDTENNEQIEFTNNPFGVYKICEMLNYLDESCKDWAESDRNLRKLCSGATHNWNGISVNRNLYQEVILALENAGRDDLLEKLKNTSIDTAVNGA